MPEAFEGGLFYSRSGDMLCVFSPKLVLSLALTFIIEKEKDLISDQISNFVSLYKAKQSVRESTKIVGVSERTVRNWVGKFKSGGGIETPSKRLDKAKKINVRTSNVIKWQVDADLHVTSRVLKETILNCWKMFPKEQFVDAFMTRLVSAGAVRGLNPTSHKIG